MEENILDAEWKTPKRSLANTTILGIVALNFFMYFVVMPMEQSLIDSHSFSPITPLVFLVMSTCFILGIGNLSKKKDNAISYLALSFNLIFWVYILFQLECFKCTQV